MSKETAARVQSFEPSDFLRHSSSELRHFRCTCQLSTRQFVMSSEVETSLISNSFQHQAQRFLASLEMTTNEISAAALASPPRARLEFPAETARAAGRRRRSRRSNAYAGRSDKSRHVRE